ncbi:unnamed protein product [Meloidogyne enterolobii]|uniref:Uncharacterized protein n=1 Tax=Meloidogyne enterolobii TaxID=390850 RepID=A0ACB1A7F5_MELEN
MVYVKPENGKEEKEIEDEEKEENKEDEEDDDDEGSVRMTIVMLLDIIYGGRKNVGGKDIFLDLNKIPEMEYKYEIGKRRRMKKIAKRIFQKSAKLLRKAVEKAQKKVKAEEKRFSFNRINFFTKRKESRVNSLPKEEELKEEKEKSLILSKKDEKSSEESSINLSKGPLGRSVTFNFGTSNAEETEGKHKRNHSEGDHSQIIQMQQDELKVVFKNFFLVSKTMQFKFTYFIVFRTKVW